MNERERKCSIVKKQQPSSTTSSILEVATCAIAAATAAAVQQQQQRSHQNCRSVGQQQLQQQCCSQFSSMYLYTGGTLQNRHWPQYSKNYVLQRRAARWRQGAAAFRGTRWRAARAQICAELIELYRLLLLQLSDRFRCVRMHRDNFFSVLFPK